MPESDETPLKKEDKAGPSKDKQSWRNLFYAYLRALWKHWETCVGFILSSTIGSFASWRGMTIPAYILWTISGIGFLAASFLAWRDQYRNTIAMQNKLMPKLKFDCGKNVPQSQVQTEFSYVSSNVKSKVNYFRLVLESAGDVPVRNCRGHLVQIKRDDMILMEDESVPLKFADGDDPAQAIKTIYTGVKTALDVVFIGEGNDVWIGAALGKMLNSVQPQQIFKEHGAYEIKVVLSGDDIQSICVPLKFLWTGNWKTAELTLNK